MSELALQRIAENKKTKDKCLDLGNCGLTQVPEEIGELVWLEELNFTNAVTSKLVGNDYYQHEESPNKINHLSSSISVLKNLKILTVAGSLRSKWNIINIDSIMYLTKLEVLNFSYNAITNLKPLSFLPNLKGVNLSHNSISNLTPLSTVILKGCKIIYTGNSLKIPPPEIVRQGDEAILRYFDEREKSGTDQIYEAKLLLIGEGGAGKTTLCRKLFNTAAELPKEQDSTRGIDIKPLYFDIANGKQFRLNIWDFAGQGKYQSAHSFFIPIVRFTYW